MGDEIWQRLLRAEQELELEIKDVVQEVWLLFLARELDSGGGKPMTLMSFGIITYTRKLTISLPFSL